MTDEENERLIDQRLRGHGEGQEHALEAAARAIEGMPNASSEHDMDTIDRGHAAHTVRALMPLRVVCYAFILQPGTTFRPLHGGYSIRNGLAVPLDVTISAEGDIDLKRPRVEPLEPPK